MSNKKQELISVYEYADRKGVQPPSVYYHIKTVGDIEVVMIGKRKAIDWNKFQHVEFPNALRFVKSEEENPLDYLRRIAKI